MSLNMNQGIQHNNNSIGGCRYGDESGNSCSIGNQNAIDTNDNDLKINNNDIELQLSERNKFFEEVMNDLKQMDENKKDLDK